MVMACNFVLEGEPSSSSSADRNGANDGIVQLGNDSVFNFKTVFLREELESPIHVDHVKGVNDDRMAAETLWKVPVAGWKMKVDSCEDDGMEIVEILLFALSLDQGSDVDATVTGMEAVEELPNEFQEAGCGGIDKIGHDLAGSENDENIYDVHVVDDISTGVKGLIGRSFSDATMQAKKLQYRAAADDLLGKSLNAIKGTQDKD